MKSIGIIANPFSGKDIRRIFSYALTIGNSEKMNIIERFILGVQDLGVDKIYIMPDPYNMGENIVSELSLKGDLKAKVSILDYKPEGNDEDTLKAAQMFNDLKVDCVVVLGGDGTSRLVAKTNPKAPIIPISTGTNNVYPRLFEGTIAGMAAAVVCQFGLNDSYVSKDKIIEVYKNGEIADYALVDAAITSKEFIGSRAVDSVDDIQELFVSLANPYSIGFSSVVGVQVVSNFEDDFGYRVKLHSGSDRVLAPFTPGKMTQVNTEKPVKMPLGQMYVYKPSAKGSVALDGERALHYEGGDLLGFVVRRKGPLRVNVEAALEYGVEHQFFKLSDLP